MAMRNHSPEPDSQTMFRYIPNKDGYHSNASVDFIIERYGHEKVFRLPGSPRKLDERIIEGFIKEVRAGQAKLIRNKYFKGK